MARNETTKRAMRAPVRGYDNWTVGELRTKLGRRSPVELERLLRYEKSTRDRKGAIEAIERVLDEKGAKKGRSKRSELAERASSVVERVREGVERGVERVRELVGMGAPELGSFDRERFMEHLSAFLEHERGGVKLYQLGLEKEVTEEQRERLQEFLDQTQRHVDILRTIIQALGGNPDELSEMAELYRQRNQALLDADTEGRGSVLNFFQNLMIVELVDHQSWRFLERVRSSVDDEEVSRALEEHVENVESEEDEHFRWAQKQCDQLAMKEVFSGEEEKSGEKEAA